MKLTEANKKSALFGEQKQNMAKQRHPCMGELPQQQSNSSDRWGPSVSESCTIFFLGQGRPPTAGAHVEHGDASTSARTHVLHHKDDVLCFARGSRIQWPPHMENFFPGKDEPSRNSDRWSVDDAEKMPKVVGFFCRDARRGAQAGAAAGEGRSGGSRRELKRQRRRARADANEIE
uniref:Uncharacterized protein n=1 Tax=Oryza sativa subsp. japonica TaxID=39947 RepID=Q6ZFW1_ORYSJ|nr:hypothetical protein [Oryza sativa Japonica Group]